MKPTQAQQLLELLRRQGERGVTPIDALREIGSFRLAARVWDLGQQGHEIETRMITVNSGARVACYVLHEHAQLAMSL